MAAGWCGCPCLWETDCLCRHLRPLATHPGCTLSCCLPPSWLIFSSHGNSSRHRRTMTVMTRPSVHPGRAWCITPSLLNNPMFTIPILLLKKPRVWEPEKLSSNHESMPRRHGTSQNHHPCQALGNITTVRSARHVWSALYTLIHLLEWRPCPQRKQSAFSLPNWRAWAS